MRRITKANITLMTLCPRGKNGVGVLYKSMQDEDLGSLGLQTVVQKGADEGELTAVVYLPEKPDYDGDVAGADVIKQMAHSFQKNGGQIDIQHDGRPVGRDRAYIAENFLIQKGDPRFADLKDYDGNPVDPTGAWGVVVKIEDPELRRLYREGEWNGVSMFGRAEVIAEKSEDAAPTWFNRFLAKVGLRDANPTEDIEMQKQELLDALAESNKSLVETLTKALTEAKPKAEPKKEEAKVEKSEPEFDPTDAKAVKEHLAKVKRETLSKSVDWSDAKAVEAYLATIEKAEDDKPEPTAEQVEMQKQIDELNAKLKKSQGESRQPGDTETKPTSVVGLSKEQTEALPIADRMAAFVNAGR